MSKQIYFRVDSNYDIGNGHLARSINVANIIKKIGYKVIFITKYRNKNTIKFGIYYHNKHVGNIKAGNINYNHNTCEISYFLGDLKNRRKGIMYKSIIKLIDQLNKSKKLIKFTAYTYVINKPSIKLLTKIGFKIEGRLKRHHYYNGKRRDILIFSYLKN